MTFFCIICPITNKESGTFVSSINTTKFQTVELNVKRYLFKTVPYFVISRHSFHKGD